MPTDKQPPHADMTRLNLLVKKDMTEVIRFEILGDGAVLIGPINWGGKFREEPLRLTRPQGEAYWNARADSGEWDFTSLRPKDRTIEGVQYDRVGPVLLCSFADGDRAAFIPRPNGLEIRTPEGYVPGCIETDPDVPGYTRVWFWPSRPQGFKLHGSGRYGHGKSHKAH